MIDKSLREKLRAELPDAAIKRHPSKSYLSVINPMFVVERLNDVFGVGGWMFKSEIIAYSEGNKPMATVKGFLRVPEARIEVEQYGGSSNDDLGDALKGAATDALTKCASYLEIGLSIYKGEKDTPAKGGNRSQANKPKPASEKQTALIEKLCIEKDVVANQLKKVREKLDAGNMTSDEARKVIDLFMKLPDMKADIPTQQRPTPDDLPY